MKTYVGTAAPGCPAAQKYRAAALLVVMLKERALCATEGPERATRIVPALCGRITRAFGLLPYLSSRAKHPGERSEPACAVEGPWVELRDPEQRVPCAQQLTTAEPA